MGLNKFRSVNLRIDKADDYFISNQFAKDGDFNGRKLVVQLTNGGLIEDQTGVALNLGWQHQKVLNKGLDPFTVVDATQGVFEISYPAEMMRTGNVVAVIQVIESGKIVETRNFTIQVEASPIDESSIVSENSFTVLQEALLTVNKYDGRISNLENTKATKAEVALFENEVNAQLAQTMTQTEFDSWVATLLDGGPSIFMETLSALNTAYPNGSSGVALVRETNPARIYAWNGSVWQDFGEYQGLELKNKVVTSEKIADKAVGLKQTQYPMAEGVPSNNMYDESQAEIGRLFPTNGAIVYDVNYRTSPYIKVEEIDWYTFSGFISAAPACWFSDIGVFSADAGFWANKTFKQPPAGAKYVRLTSTLNNTGNLQFEKGKVATPYQSPYPKTKIEPASITKEMLNFVIEINSKWFGKTFFTFGDSITWYDGQIFNTGLESGKVAKGYQSYMRERLGCTVINKGVSGNRMPQILTTIKAQIYTGVSAVTITVGANDFRVSEATEPFGSIKTIGSVFDETSFVGSLQSAIEYILSQNPEIKIYLLTPIKGWGTSVMPNKFPDSIKDIAKLYSLTICDWYYDSGINDITKTIYINDPDDLGYKLHPNNKGFARMADILIPVLENS